ncbi:heavy-metal-associated domain-containing protein [Virgibacillus sp. MSP4-1]|uniref:heavy-metal-associated domain-containing protein n=1 Tax=Virgibacillus sp. MSP4-1 TaxID=2700081 RepID=UPI00039E8843|nr:heavy metal-associated domain-containing protein [Virgibacillus sp. MSP4-1]QHS21958.1 heavy-metal-associated domain-containing protein [Virgibacillus sp. MSP4-1]
MPHNTFFIKEATAHENIQELEAFLMNVSGVERVLVDPDDGEIKVEYNNEEIELQEIASNIVSQGFHIET